MAEMVEGVAVWFTIGRADGEAVGEGHAADAAEAFGFGAPEDIGQSEDGVWAVAVPARVWAVVEAEGVWEGDAAGYHAVASEDGR